MNYLDIDMSVKLATPKWYTPYIKGYPMVKLGEFCKTRGFSVDSEYNTYSDISTLYFHRCSIVGKAGARYKIPGEGINKHSDIFNIEDMLIKQLREDFDIKEEMQYMKIPRISEISKATINARYGVCNDKPEIKNVIFSGPCTIVMWSDGDKTIVRCGEDDIFDKEKGLAMAISKKMLGTNSSKSSYYDVFKEYIQEKEEA